MEDYYTDCSGNRWVDPDGIYTEQSYPCIQCKQSTHRTDINFEAPVHDGFCLSSLWKEYYAALNNHGRI